jgi:Inorganic pyrophosphatase
MRLDRRLYSAVSFPADYGFVAGTEGADGEPPDALVLLEDPTSHPTDPHPAAVAAHHPPGGQPRPLGQCTSSTWLTPSPTPVR